MSSPAIEPRRVLVTGSAGMIGQCVCNALVARGHVVRGFDRRATPGLADCVVGDITDLQALVDAGRGMDTLVHLAATPDVADFVADLVPANVIGLHNACESARLSGHRRLVLASSAQVVSGLRQAYKPPITLADGVAPTNFYALSKVLAEEMGRMYARVWGMSVIAARPGFLPRDRASVEQIRRSIPPNPWYLSPRDAGLFFALCVEARDIKFETFFATSRVENPLFDISETRRVLGYEPQDTQPQGLDEILRIIDANPPTAI
ncbi:MAG: NAD(P)-dependent oxidoreductase [Planctomycetota bacterium]|nr:NAD(P)-dependent oxidoreductase [Planctomycetota bacterium]